MSSNPVAFGHDLATGFRAAQAFVFIWPDFSLFRRSFVQRRE
jgi:hypothetical protein